jgi:P-type conjugative transfer protein TrbJ
MKRIVLFVVVVSMLFAVTPTQTGAGVVAGFATEWTQILNHVQLIQSYIRQGLQLENELNQYQLALKQSLVQPNQVFGAIQQDLGQLAQLVQGGRALAYSMANLDAQFRNTFTGYGFRSHGYFQDYQKWSQTSLDTTLNSLKAVGFQGQQLQSQQSILAALRAQSAGAGGEVGNQIAEQQVEQLMALRQLMLVDLESKQAYQAEQIQKEQAAAAAGQQVFGKQHMVTDDKKY